MEPAPDICPSCGENFSSVHGQTWIVRGKFYCCEECARKAANNL